MGTRASERSGALSDSGHLDLDLRRETILRQAVPNPPAGGGWAEWSSRPVSGSVSANLYAGAGGRGLVEKRWNGLRLGDVVSVVARTRRMLITDMDLDDPGAVVCAWRPRRREPPRERVYRVSNLILVQRTAKP